MNFITSLRTGMQRDTYIRDHFLRKISIFGIATILLLATSVTIVVAYDNWLQTSKDASSSGYTSGISMYPINEYPRPASGVPPSYAYISNLDDPHRGGNIGTHIAAWYEGSQTETNLRIAFTTTNRDNVGAIYCVDSDGDNINNYPILFEDGNWNSKGDAESSVAVYYDGVDQEHDTVIVAALNSLSDNYGYGNTNQARVYDLGGNLHWWNKTDDWVSRHCSPVVWIDPDWGDSNDNGYNDDDFAYVFEYDEESFPGNTRVKSLDLTIDKNGGELMASYNSTWFQGLTPTYCTPVIREVPIDDYQDTDTYMFFLLDEWTYSDNIDIWLKTGTRAIAINIDPYDNVNGKYDTVFNIQLPKYGEQVIPDPMDPENQQLWETIDMHYTVNMDPAAVHMFEDYGGESIDWWGFVFGPAEGSTGYGYVIFFVEMDGTISAKYDLSYPVTKYGAGSATQTNPLVIGSPAVENAASPYYEGIYVLYHDRATGRIGTAYFRDIDVIDDNQVHLTEIYLSNDEYKPVSPVITDEFLYVGCSHTTRNTPYEFMGGMVYINLDTIRANRTMGFFHTLPWSLDDIALQNHWNATPAIIQTSSSNQYLYMGTSDLNLYGGRLWRLST